MRRFYICLFVIGFSGSTLLFAQHGREPDRTPRGLEVIDRAYREGKISLDQKVLYQLHAVNAPEKLPGNLRSELTYPLKCGTPALLEYRRYEPKLQPSTLAEIESTRRAKSTLQLQETYLSPDGKFRIHYTNSGQDSVSVTDTSGVDGVPDYVEWVAAAADSSWRHEVQNLGYTDPVAGSSDPYDVYIENLNAYGETRLSGGITYIVIHNNFEGFPPNTDPEGDVKGAIKVTMAHELKHAVQYVATQWRGESDRWTEMDATLMEEVVYDNVNDYYNYIQSQSLRSIFLNPETSFYPGSYEHITWALYFEEKYGSEFWVNVWEELRTDPQSIRFTEAIRTVLTENDPFEYNFVESQLWHFASGPDRSPSDFGFEERSNYPDPSITTFLSGVDSLTTPISVNSLAANYLELFPEAGTPGFVRVIFTRSASHMGMGLIAYLKDGSTEQVFVTEGEALVISEQTTWEWSNLDRLGIVIANNSENDAGSYELRVISDIPEEITLSQNYPNPFHPGTTIPFTLNQESRVELKVYDILGRLIHTLIDDTLPAGFYAPQFEAGNLASGIYIYRLVTDEVVLTKKMTVIK